MNRNENIVKLKDGRKLGFAEFGDLKGKPLFFFHGWPSCRLHAKYLDDIAKNLKIRVIAPDRPGFGLSDYKKDRSLLDWPDDVLELTHKINVKKFSIIGVSGGGPYAAVCAYKIPTNVDKVGIIVGLGPILKNTPNALGEMTFINKFAWKNYHKFPILRTITCGLHYLNAKYGPSLGLYRYFFGAKRDKQLSTSQFRKELREGIKEAFRSGYKGAELDLKIYTSDWNFDLRKIKSDVYLWYGADDKNVSLNMGKYYASNIPNSKLKIYPSEGHLCQITHAEEILKTLI